MHIPKVYIDTSVIGGCFDDEFREYSNKLFNEFKSGLKIAVISDITLDELENAPDHVQKKINEIPDKFKELILLDDESKELSQNYIIEKVVTMKYLADAQHIAIATINKIDLLVSWNFKHIVNLDKIQNYNAVNIKNGYKGLEIRTPREVIHEK